MEIKLQVLINAPGVRGTKPVISHNIIKDKPRVKKRGDIEPGEDTRCVTLRNVPTKQIQ